MLNTSNSMELKRPGTGKTGPKELSDERDEKS
jgi:hypothetical protein